MANNRDDFPAKIKTALAHRAGYVCSFPGCGRHTSGPSDESESAYSSIGIAAHISAAAPGGPRYDSEMSSDERKNINNAIWLCSNHSIKIDRDYVQYTKEILIDMKRVHEKIMNGHTSIVKSNDLIAIGPEVVATGELIGVGNNEWKFRLDNFFVGDITKLLRFIDEFKEIDDYDKFVLINELGDGRQILSAPKLDKVFGHYEVSFIVAPAFKRIKAQDLGTTFAEGDDGDIFVHNGSFATISGLEALPQKIRNCLSMAQGENFFHPRFGSRIGEYFWIFNDTPSLLSQLLKLEVIRLASIPYDDGPVSGIYTPLKCVNRVVQITLSDITPVGNRMPISFSFEVEGIGAWTKELSIFISPFSCD